MFQRLSRSIELMKASWNVLQKDKELMWFPIFSGVASMLTVGSFLIPIVLYVWHEAPMAEHFDRQTLSTAWYVYMFLFYVMTFFVTYFFNVAVMHCAAIRMDGGDPTVADGFKGAASRGVQIFLWAVVSATVGLVLNAVERRLGLIGRIIVGLIGCAWTIVTYFAVPVLIFEKAGVGGAVKRSAELVKKTWGEAAVANVGIGVARMYFSLLGFAPFFLGIWLAANDAPKALALASIGVAILYWLALSIVTSTLQSIFHVALYRYASTGQVPDGFGHELVAGYLVRRV